MARAEFTWKGFVWRFLAALLLVGLTYNPHGYSYFDWAIKPLPEGFTPGKALAGVALLIVWIVFLRATLASLGRIGVLLALLFFGLAIWALYSWGWISPDSSTEMTYLALIVIASLMALGVSWSFVRRRLTGQLDVDRIDE